MSSKQTKSSRDPPPPGGSSEQKLPPSRTPSTGPSPHVFSASGNNVEEISNLGNIPPGKNTLPRTPVYKAATTATGAASFAQRSSPDESTNRVASDLEGNSPPSSDSENGTVTMAEPEITLQDAPNVAEVKNIFLPFEETYPLHDTRIPRCLLIDEKIHILKLMYYKGDELYNSILPEARTFDGNAVVRQNCKGKLLGYFKQLDEFVIPETKSPDERESLSHLFYLLSSISRLLFQECIWTFVMRRNLQRENPDAYNVFVQKDDETRAVYYLRTSAILTPFFRLLSKRHYQQPTLFYNVTLEPGSKIEPVEKLRARSPEREAVAKRIMLPSNNLPYVITKMKKADKLQPLPQLQPGSQTQRYINQIYELLKKSHPGDENIDSRTVSYEDEQMAAMASRAEKRGTFQTFHASMPQSFLDQPTSFLDPRVEEEIAQARQEIRSEEAELMSRIDALQRKKQSFANYRQPPMPPSPETNPRDSFPSQSTPNYRGERGPGGLDDLSRRFANLGLGGQGSGQGTQGPEQRAQAPERPRCPPPLTDEQTFRQMEESGNSFRFFNPEVPGNPEATALNERQLCDKVADKLKDLNRRIHLPLFFGDPKDFPFWKAYHTNNILNNTSLDDFEKADRVKRCLRGKAAKICEKPRGLGPSRDLANRQKWLPQGAGGTLNQFYSAEVKLKTSVSSESGIDRALWYCLVG